MNAYTGLLFLHGHIADPRLFDDGAGYAQATYGNRVANERGLRERWADERRQHHAPAEAGREDDIAACTRAA